MTLSASDNLQKPLLGKLRFTSILLVETGLHIGSGSENLSIGGLDHPVVRDPLKLHPYLPGSSIKGKLRSILERVLKKPLNRKGSRDTYRYESDDLENGYSDEGNIPFQGASTCPLSRIFGSTGKNCWVKTATVDEKGLQDLKIDSKDPRDIRGENCTYIRGRNAPSRLIVRDCHLREESIRALERVDTGLYMTEWKFENGLDRITAAANPRQIERVPKGSRFDFEMVYTVENEDQVEEDLKNLAISLAILEDDALGGHGSRGYGKVSFQDFKFYYRDLKQYQVNSAGDLRTPLDTKTNTEDLLENFNNLNEKVQSKLKALPPSNGSEA